MRNLLIIFFLSCFSLHATDHRNDDILIRNWGQEFVNHHDFHVTIYELSELQRNDTTTKALLRQKAQRIVNNLKEKNGVSLATTMLPIALHNLRILSDNIGSSVGMGHCKITSTSNKDTYIITKFKVCEQEQ